MSAPPEQTQTQPLSQDEIARLDALKSDGALSGIAFFVITLLVVMVTWERYGVFWTVMALLAGLAMTALTVLVSYSTSTSLQADIDGGIKRLVAAKVVKVVHGGEQSRYRIELLTQETPPCKLEFTLPEREFFEVEYGEQVQVAYAPASKTVINVVAVGYEYTLGAEDAAWQAAVEQNDSAQARLELRRTQRDAARKLRQATASAQPAGDTPDDVCELRPQATVSMDSTPQRAAPRITEPLSARDRDRLAPTRMGGCRIVAFLGVLGLVFAAIWALAGMGGIGAGASAATAAITVVVLGWVGFMLANEDDKLQSDLDEGIKVSVRGRISHMRTESSEGGSPYSFITVTTDESPPQTIMFVVESRLYHALLPEDAVRIVYVPVSKTILHLQTDTYRYSLRQKSD
ncbi:MULTISPECIES: hypothetical protein [unclassified Lysobacter]|uniref:hypothetical protein n=1 Tax=unclassified Lysobacter TaxID=2635362 RepID=UPI001BE9796A|nr:MULTISPECIES: hypothetical protein [unclassified Lysobacter]MBT2746967.1 hypothetical protein [Lysobacter sp. ISL-42]MBT2750571.1 hypothetical protein [Lysobacter sp. ISL-50]MBT2776418.1 hypothetical protein [Lysobacter sp. ISL-54]MBT2780912.1 hypothetical protein [Lysobacter sp. ISL-52]